MKNKVTTFFPIIRQITSFNHMQNVEVILSKHIAYVTELTNK